MDTTTATILENNVTSKRRRFQPPITNFFTPAPTTDCEGDPDSHSRPVSHHHYAAATQTPTPSVPAKVQVSLLHVGMRVRKAVAQGYKTAASLAKLEEQHHHHKMTSPASGSDERKRNYSTYFQQHTELAPFCGVSKMGDVAVSPFHGQQHHIPASRPELLGRMVVNNGDNALVTTDDGDLYSLPSSSQESTTSTTSSFNSSVQKRPFDSNTDLDDMEDDVDECELDSMNTGIYNETHAMPFSRDTVTIPRQRRVILSPRQPRRRQPQHQRKSGSSRPQNQTPIGTSMDLEMEIDDFEDAAFLRAREEVDMDERCVSGMTWT